ncbi:MAG: metal-dependent hydrolase [Pyrinomonadaceae bacterium]
MPMPIAHGFLGASIVAAVYPKVFKARYYLPILTGAFLANAADFDFLLVFATHDKDWHRGFTHSIIFSLIVGLLFYIYFGRTEWRKSLAFSLAFASHFVLDFITTKIGGGLELFFPVTNERFGLHWFGLSEYPSKMSLTEIILAVLIEFAIFFSIFLAVIFLRDKFRNRFGN